MTHQPIEPDSAAATRPKRGGCTGQQFRSEGTLIRVADHVWPAVGASREVTDAAYIFPNKFNVETVRMQTFPEALNQTEL